MSFIQEALTMGLSTIDTGLFEYKDRYSSIWYEQLRGVSRTLELPTLGIFTGGPETLIEDREYVGAVSLEYKFFGNAMAVDAVLDSVKNLSTIDNNIKENTVFSANLTQMSSELLIINNNTPSTNNGMIVPMINIENSYNGSKAAMYSFGIGIVDQEYNIIGSVSLRKKISSMRQIHILCSNTTLESNIGSYIDVFNDNITDLVDQNFNKIIPPEDAMKSLGMVEKLGKRRYSAIVNNLAVATQQGQDFDVDNIPPINAWNMFMAIVTYSCKEENINAKKMLDNIAERTLNIPTKMLAAL